MSSRIKLRTSVLDGQHKLSVSVGIYEQRRAILPTLNVPDRLRPGILQVAELSETGFDQLLSALKKAPACKDTRELLSWIADETPAITEQDRNAIIRSLVPMFRVQRNSDVSPSTFASDVWDSVATPGVDRGLLVSRISLLIEEAALDLASARIGDVKQEVERNFCKIRIMTDLRPAFAEPNEFPADMAVIHNLQIGYHDGMGKHLEFYISLDGSDLEDLKKAIVEAETRAKTLEKLLNKSGVNLHR
jgi:hypothetical protein